MPAPGGENGEVTTDQAYSYMDAVDAASDRVITGALEKKSWQDRELRWAMIGHPDHLDRRSLKAIAKAAQALRNPKTPPWLARQIAKRFPAILWIASNVHGGEESGTDASMRVLYELADRTDCAARQILDNSIVVLLPTQNPDGRELNTRQNFYGFDMNRDWFARTQPETDGKLELLRQYPGPLFVDDHEMGAATFFFPPNADPIYHEITDESVDWINNIYGASLASEFNRQGIPFFNRDIYDLFYMGYGDTVPATGFISAGMTYEKNNGEPIAKRAYEQYVAQWVSLSQGAIRKRAILEGWASAWREAYQQGQAGFLEPNEIVNPGNEVATQVPTEPLRHYFITERRDSKQREVKAMIRRLQRMDVDVYRLAKRTWVPDFTPYGRSTRGQWMARGTWYVPMAQMQKHWVQAMLNEDTYTPFPYFYDVTAWSQPLLFNVRGGYSGERLRLRARGVDELADPGAPAAPADAPKIAVFQLSETSTSAIESTGWLRYLLEQVWDLPYDKLDAGQIAGGGLSGYDAVLIPNGPAADGADSARHGRGRRPACLDQRRRPPDQLARGHAPGRPARPDHGAPERAFCDQPGARQPVPRAHGRRHAPAPRRGRVRMGLLRVRRADAGLVARPRGSRVPARRQPRLVHLGLRPGSGGAGRHGRGGRRAGRRRPGDRLRGRAQLPRVHYGLPEDPEKRPARRRARRRPRRPGRLRSACSKRGSRQARRCQDPRHEL